MSDSAIDLDHDGNPVKKNATRRDQVNIAFGTGEVWILGRWDWEPFCEGLRSRGQGSKQWVRRKEHLFVF